MHCGDRRLQLVRADRSLRQRAADERDALGDQCAIPERAILLVERDELAVGRCARPARVGEQHQREQPGHLRVVR